MLKPFVKTEFGCLAIITRLIGSHEAPIIDLTLFDSTCEFLKLCESSKQLKENFTVPANHIKGQ